MTTDCNSSTGFGAGEVIAIVVGIINLCGVIMAALAWWEQRKAKSSPTDVEFTPATLKTLQPLEKAIQDLQSQQRLTNRLTAAHSLAWLTSDPNHRSSIPEVILEHFYDTIKEVN
jgi:hypothetical protein